MLNKITTDKVIKAYIDDYQKIREKFKSTLSSLGFVWSPGSYKKSVSGIENVWINYMTRVSLRIRWGVIGSSAILYVEIEADDVTKERILEFVDLYEIVNGISPPITDFGELNNKGLILKKQRGEKSKEKKIETEKDSWCCYELSKEDIKEVAERKELDIEEINWDDVVHYIKKGISYALENRDEIIEDAIKQAKSTSSVKEV